MNCSINIEHIEMNFHGKMALQDVNLKVKEGEIIGLLGPSGAGKTTLIKILTGQLTQTNGVAEILNQDTTHLDNQTLSKIGMVLDTSGLYQRLDCYSNLLLYVRLHKVGKDRIHEVMKQVGLEDAMHTVCGKLSKGMTQRFILARAILHRPKLLFLDEPTSGLDPLSARDIHNLIKKLQEEGTTIFLTTHNMEEAHKLCDHVALLHEGKIVEYGSPSELCSKYDHEHKVIITDNDDQKIEFHNLQENALLIADYFKQGKVKEIHSVQPNLETIFIHLTGKELDHDVTL